MIITGATEEEKILVFYICMCAQRKKGTKNGSPHSKKRSKKIARQIR
jgi:hypothetical protein